MDSACRPVSPVQRLRTLLEAFGDAKRTRIRWLLGSLAAIFLITLVLGWQLHRRSEFLTSLVESDAQLLGNDVTANEAWGEDVSILLRSSFWLHRYLGWGNETPRSIRSIGADGDGFSDRDFRAIATISELRHLYLTGTRVTDKTVARLRGMRRLRTLDLAFTEVTDKALQYLRSCDSLRRLSINETAISRDAIEAFLDVRPDVSVRWCPASDEKHRQAVRSLLSCGARVFLGERDAIQDRPREATVFFRRRFREVNHETQTASFRYLNNVNPATSLWLDGIVLTEAEHEVLASLAHLRGLRLDRLRTPSYAWIESMTALESLTLGQRLPTDTVLRHACRLPNLQSVEATGVTDQGARELGRLHDMTNLRLRSSDIGDDSVATWRGLDKLRWLYLDSSRITNRCLTTIGNMNTLVRLELIRNQINNAGLANLQGLDQLRILNITATRVTPAGFVHLTPMVELSQLWWRGGEPDSGHVDLFDKIMDLLWYDLSFAEDERIEKLIVDLVADHPAMDFSLAGQPIDRASPQQWLPKLMALLAPVREFRRGLPGCRLR